MVGGEPFHFITMDEKEREFWKKIGQQIAKARDNKSPGRIAYDRRRKKVTQGVLAEHIGLSRPSVANIELGRQRIDLYTFTKIMEFLK